MSDVAGLMERLRRNSLRYDDAVGVVMREAATALTRQAALIEEAKEVVTALEKANDDLCQARTNDQYLSLIDGGQRYLLSALDDARRSARALLAKLEE